MIRYIAALLALLAASTALAQQPFDPAKVIAAQREALAPFRYMDGVWRGTALTLRPSGEKHVTTHTERVGPFLDGSVKVIEGRSYEEGGRVGFNALGIISYDVARKTYTLRSYALGRSGDFALTPTADGYQWEIPAGPGKTIRYVATVKDGTWYEVGDMLAAEARPVRIFEMTLKRVGDTDWPAANPVPQR